jgi:hypothetical protein
MLTEEQVHEIADRFVKSVHDPNVREPDLSDLAYEDHNAVLGTVAKITSKVVAAQEKALREMHEKWQRSGSVLRPGRAAL